MEGKFKVLMSTDSMGGVWTYSLELIRGLQQYKIDFLLAVLDRPLSRSQRNDLAGLNNITIVENNYKLEWMDTPWKDVDLSGEWLLEMRDAYKPDIVHLNGYSLGALNWNLPILVTAHSCVLSWYDQVRRSKAPESWYHYGFRVMRGLLNADMIVTPSKTMLHYLNKFYGHFKNMKVIYNGINSSDFTSGDKKEIVFSMGRLWDEGKNIPALINCSPFINWPVYFAGDDKDPFGANYLGDNNKNFLGVISRSEVAKRLSEASIFAHPAKYEPFGLSPLEAAYSGCALVLGDIESLREIWSDSAVYADPFNDDDITEKINWLIEDQKLREVYARKALAHAQKYNISTMALQYYTLYNDMINNHLKMKKEITAAK